MVVYVVRVSKNDIKLLTLLYNNLIFLFALNGGFNLARNSCFITKDKFIKFLKKKIAFNFVQ